MFGEYLNYVGHVEQGVYYVGHVEQGVYYVGQGDYVEQGVYYVEQGVYHVEPGVYYVEQGVCYVGSGAPAIAACSHRTTLYTLSLGHQIKSSIRATRYDASPVTRPYRPIECSSQNPGIVG